MVGTRKWSLDGERNHWVCPGKIGLAPEPPFSLLSGHHRMSNPVLPHSPSVGWNHVTKYSSTLELFSQTDEK